MESLPAQDFANRFVSAYGAGWNEVFTMVTNERPCAQHMAEFIDDIEFYGQQTPVYVDDTGCVESGNRIVLAQCILDGNIDFKVEPSPYFDAQELCVVEFDIESGDIDNLQRHAADYLSFRADRDWVDLVDFQVDGDEGFAVLHCPSGQYTADRIEPLISRRLEGIAGVPVMGLRVSMLDPASVDDDGHE